MFFEIKLSNDSFQIIDFDFYENKIRLEITFNPLAKRWFMNVINPNNENEYITQSLAMNVGVKLLSRINTNYFFVVTDNTQNGIDPQSQDDWLGRCSLFIKRKD